MATLPYPQPPKYLREENIAMANYRQQKPQTFLEELYANHRNSIYRVALRVTHNPDDAEDAVQNVFLRMMRTEKRPDGARGAAAYLRRAATNAAVDVIRERTHRAETNILPFHPAANPTLLEQQQVRQVLDNLPHANARLLELHYRDGYLYEELAALFGIPVGTVKSRLHSIRSAAKEFAYRRASGGRRTERELSIGGH